MNEIDKIKLREIEKEIARQMGVDTISEANLKGDWKKVDPEIRKPYVEYVASRIAETFRLMDKGTSPKILEKVKAGDPTKAFLLLEEP